MGYAAAFEAAQIDLDLASTMTTAELRELLPEKTPLGHRLRLSRLLGQQMAAAQKRQGGRRRGAGSPQLRLPADPAWMVHMDREAMAYLAQRERRKRPVLYPRMEYPYIYTSVTHHTA
eukprot:COSAG05_NODE_1114_length_5840_cov_2.676886_8_plen_118_part_00